MTTAQNLIDETRSYLLPTAKEALNTLSGSHNASVTTITFTYDITAINAGDTIAVDLEVMHVWSTTPASKTVVVIRGQGGSTAASHADGALVRVNPRFSDFTILRAVNADLDDLSSPSNGLWAQPETVVELTYQPQIRGYNLTGTASSFLSVLAVHYDTPGPWKDWPEVRYYQIKRAMDTTDFASGTMIQLTRGGYPGRDVRVTLSLPFTHFTTTADDATTVAGLGATMTDIPPLGAAARLSGVRETQRNQFESQGDPRRATEVPPNAQLAGMTGLLRLRKSRIDAEAARLANNYPTRRKVG